MPASDFYPKHVLGSIQVINPNWHELRKQEKCSSLGPPRNKFSKTQWAWQGVKLTQLMSIFTSKKVWKFLVKVQLTKSDQQRTLGRKCSVPCQLGLMLILFMARVTFAKSISSLNFIKDFFLVGIRFFKPSWIDSREIWHGWGSTSMVATKSLNWPF